MGCWGGGGELIYILLHELTNLHVIFFALHLSFIHPPFPWAGFVVAFLASEGQTCPYEVVFYQSRWRVNEPRLGPNPLWMMGKKTKQ